MIALGDIFGIGSSSVISRLFGQKQDEEGKNVSGFCFYGAIVCGILVSLIMMIARKTNFNNPWNKSSNTSLCQPILYLYGFRSNFNYRFLDS